VKVAWAAHCERLSTAHEKKWDVSCLICLDTIDTRTTASFGLMCTHEKSTVTRSLVVRARGCTCTGDQICQTALDMEVKVMVLGKVRVCEGCFPLWLHNERDGGTHRCSVCFRDEPGACSAVMVSAVGP
jgi:hypothetical protein